MPTDKPHPKSPAQPSSKRVDTKKTPTVAPLPLTFAGAAALPPPAIPAPVQAGEPKENPRHAHPINPLWGSGEDRRADDRSYRGPPRHKNFGSSRGRGKGKGRGGVQAPHANPEPRNAPHALAQKVPLKKKEAKAKPLNEGDATFIAAVAKEAPELLKQLQDNKPEERDWFTVELLAAPQSQWQNLPDLSNFDVERQMLTAITAAAGLGAEHSIRMDSIKAFKTEKHSSKEYYFQLLCTSEGALDNIIAEMGGKIWDNSGFKLDFLQPKESVFGHRFQISLKGLPEPFRSYSEIQ